MPFPLPTHLYVFDFIRPTAVSLDAPFSKNAEHRIIISMYEEEDDYYAGLQLIHGVVRHVVQFQHLHDLVYEALMSRSAMTLEDSVNNLYCSDPLLPGLLLDNHGDLKHARKVKRMREADANPRLYSTRRFII